MRWRLSHERSIALASIPGIGFGVATALAASIPDPPPWTSGRAFSAYLGLVPVQHSSAHRTRLGHIGRGGDQCLKRAIFLASRSAATLCYRSIRRSTRFASTSATPARRPSSIGTSRKSKPMKGTAVPQQPRSARSCKPRSPTWQAGSSTGSKNGSTCCRLATRIRSTARRRRCSEGRTTRATAAPSSMPV